MLITGKNKQDNLFKIYNYLVKHKVDFSSNKVIINYNRKFTSEEVELLNEIGEFVVISSLKQSEDLTGKVINFNQVKSVKRADIPSEHSKLEIYKITQNMLSPHQKKTLNFLLNLVTSGILDAGEEVIVLNGEEEYIDSAFLIRVGSCKLFTDFSIIETYCSPYIA
jgi:hypothetical protein